MGATAEALPSRAQGVRSSVARKPFVLMRGGFRLLLEPDGSLQSFDSLPEHRALFGSERLLFFKVQVGVVIQAGRPDWAVRVVPRSAHFAGRIFESVEVAQSIEFFRGPSSGYVRRVRLRNTGYSPIALRLIDVLDPTAAQWGGSSGRWGSLGVNAFNRGSHVAMDEISDPPSARVVGSLPAPKKFFMTTDRSRAQESGASGELPDQTAGMSGQVIVVSLHEIDLPPTESKEVIFASIYNPVRLEDALSDFGRISSGEKSARKNGPSFACSSQGVTEALDWAVAALGNAQFESNTLDRIDSLRAIVLTDPEAAKSMLFDAKKMLRNDGSVPHSLDPTRGALLETAVLLKTASEFLLLSRDKKLTRTYFPTLKKLAGALLSASKDESVANDQGLPQGWRRLMGRGYPTGEIPEVSLALAAGLLGASQVARQISKSDDAGRFRERSEMVSERVRKKLLDERGFLALCLDSAGRLRGDETIDMAIAAYRHQFDRPAEQAVAHRLLERDFETTYGARTVPHSNSLYFNPSYGNGQLGGYWPRAALAHAILCYRVGLSGTGSLTLEKVAKLTGEESVRLGSSPGEFPLWVDVDSREAHGNHSDPVSAARLLEALIEGELGLRVDGGEVSFSPPVTSGLKWVAASDFWAGEPVSVFVGRGAGKAHAFISGSHVSGKEASKFANAERIESTPKGTMALSFSGPGQTICVANPSTLPVRGPLSFSPRGTELSKRLSTPLDEYDIANGTWKKVAALRVFPTMTFEVSLGTGEWKAFRLSTA
jgi:hypothetical protein